MDTSLANRLSPLIADDGFDPVSEIRRLRQDLILRLKQLQESIASEAVGNIEKPEVSSESGTILYVSQDFKRSNETPLNVGKPEFDVPVETYTETIVTAPSESVVVLCEEPAHEELVQEESASVRVLRWINAVLIGIGAAGAVFGLCYFLLRKHSVHPQGLAMTLLVVGGAMVLVGIIGRLSHRTQFSGTTGPGSW
jgi:hypothetical protein